MSSITGLGLSLPLRKSLRTCSASRINAGRRQQPPQLDSPPDVAQSAANGKDDDTDDKLAPEAVAENQEVEEELIDAAPEAIKQFHVDVQTHIATTMEPLDANDGDNGDDATTHSLHLTAVPVPPTPPNSPLSDTNVVYAAWSSTPVPLAARHLDEASDENASYNADTGTCGTTGYHKVKKIIRLINPSAKKFAHKCLIAWERLDSATGSSWDNTIEQLEKMPDGAWKELMEAPVSDGGPSRKKKKKRILWKGIRIVVRRK